MTGVILYQSKYGATKKYADWLSEETKFTCIETKKANIKEVAKYDTIILGGGIYASGIAGLSFLKKNIDILKEKKIAVFCCGASPYEEKAFQEIVRHNMKDGLSDIPCFYCRGAWDMDSMSFKDKTLCSLLRNAVSKKNPDEYEVWEKALMAAGEDKCDWTDKKYLTPILENINWNISENFFLTLETVMNEIHKWYESITKKYAEAIKFEIDKDEKNIFIVNFETERYIAQLVVQDIGFHPHRFVEFIVLDKKENIHQNYPYLFHDNENDSVSNIIEQLNSGIEFIIH